MAQPWISVFGDDAYRSLQEKAVLLLSLVRHHALVDGNQRWAWCATRVVGLLSGHDLTCTVDGAEKLMLAAAAGRLDVPEISAWLDARRGTASERRLSAYRRGTDLGRGRARMPTPRCG